MSFFGCVFNEYIILYCCGLENETQDEIADRADKQIKKELNDINTFNNNEDDDDSRKSSSFTSFNDYGLGI